MLSQTTRVELGCRCAIRALLLNEGTLLQVLSAGEKFLPMYFEFEFRKGHPYNKCHFSWVEPRA